MDKGKEKLGKDCVNDFFCFVKFQMCWYHVTFDLDLEHILDAGLPGDHRVQVWSQSSHFSGERSDLRKMLTDKQTTDRRRTPHHCISSLE